MSSPDRVGPYLVRARLGAGGMGEVFLAEDTRLGRQVALKSVSEEWAREPAARRRLLREARAAAALNHPGIAAVYDVLEPGDSAYIVMEYVPGETLARKLAAGPVGVQTTLFVGIQLCEALAAAHAKGILHRDIKPSNVVLTPEGRLKVLDFGLARALSAAESDESLGSLPPASRGRIAGTPAYIPPERYEGASPGETEDVYSTGVLLYELLSGRRPFTGADVAHLAAAILGGRPAPLSSVAPGVPRALASVVERAMARQPRDRQPTALALRDDLERVRAFSDLDTRTSATVARTPRRKLALLAAASAAVVLLALGFGHPSTRPAAPAARPPAVPVVLVLPLVNATGQSGDEPMGTGLADVVVAALARIPRVNVLSLAAGRDCARARRDLACAASIGADYVLDGSLQRQRDQVRVTLSLVDRRVAAGRLERVVRRRTRRPVRVPADGGGGRRHRPATERGGFRGTASPARPERASLRRLRRGPAPARAPGRSGQRRSRDRPAGGRDCARAAVRPGAGRPRAGALGEVRGDEGRRGVEARGGRPRGGPRSRPGPPGGPRGAGRRPEYEGPAARGGEGGSPRHQGAGGQRRSARAPRQRARGAGPYGRGPRRAASRDRSASRLLAALRRRSPRASTTGERSTRQRPAGGRSSSCDPTAPGVT